MGEETEGWGALFFPALQIGPMPDFKEIETSLTIWDLMKCYPYTFGKIQLIFDTAGFIFIKTPDKRRALDIYNKIVFAALVQNMVAFPVWDLELLPAKINENGEISTRTFSSSNLRGLLGINIDKIGENIISYDEDEISETLGWHISAERFRDMLDFAQQIDKIPNIEMDISLLSEAHRFLYEWKDIQAYFASWNVIERWVSHLWKFEIVEGRKKPQVDRLNQDTEWSISQKIDVLNILGMIDDELRDELTPLRNIRNDLVHKGKPPERENVIKCYIIAKKILREFISTSSTIS